MDEAYFKPLSLVMAKETGSRKVAHSFVRGNAVSRDTVQNRVRKNANYDILY